MNVLTIYNKMSAFQRVIWALILGILTGIFVGEPAGELKIVGNGYIRLLQMTVLPYVVVSIIGGLGRLNSGMAREIGTKAAMVIVFIWLATMVTLLFLPLAYPDWESAGFFSTSLAVESADFDFLKLYIPSNIFYAMSNSIVPAVVLFSLLLGVALINVANKETLIVLTTNVGDGLMRVASYVAKLAPLGIFAIAASAAGTLHPEELGRLQIFLYVYLIAWVILAFFLLPVLIHWATPFSYREVMKESGEAMITALATGTVLVVLPMIVERCKAMLEKHSMDCEETLSAVDVLVPTAYSFPSVGTLLGLGFILFSAWYIGSPLSLDQYPAYVMMGIFSAFGSMAVAIPFMLDYFHMPADQFQLYLLGSVVTARFATALAALHAFVVTLLVSAAILKRLNKRRMLQVVAIHLGVTAGIMIVAGFAFTYLIPYQYEGGKSFEAMGIMGDGVPVKIVKQTTPISDADKNRPRQDVIRERGTLRIGYSANTLPFSYRNKEGQVVGFDIDMMHSLAKDLGVDLEIMRFKNRKESSQLLSDGRLDIVVGGIAITPELALEFVFTRAYTYHTLGLIVPDARRDEFSSISKMKGMENLRFSAPSATYYVEPIKKMFPDASFEKVDSPRKYFREKYKTTDAFIFSAETGSAWTLLYPAYSVVVPKGLKMKAPVGFALPIGQLDFVQFMNTWLELKKDDGFQQKVYDHWILGKDTKKTKPRWSVMRNVLGWVD
ncbi:MAG TPA: cation:dicarboxylase symporter family transporter [Gammaproteobacteria bacterium]|nr:cation:dicarboxylase symporter family transporter [Gammaproteobacteria bacterium]